MESHLIISIGRQIGAGGLGVARILAQEFFTFGELGIKLII